MRVWLEFFQFLIWAHKVHKGPQGTQGFQGIQGDAGGFGGATFDYTFDGSGTTEINTAVGDIRFNNATPSAVTEIYIDERDDNFANLDNYYASLDTVTGLVKGTLKIMRKADPNNFFVFDYEDITDSTGYWKFEVNYSNW